MNALELKIPPPLVAAAVAALMGALAWLAPALSMVVPGRAVLAPLLALLGGALAAAGVWRFVQHRTTVHPHRPQETQTLVTDGAYRFSRNPMYLGILLVLLAWALWLGNAPAALLGPAAFVAYLNRFQIGPEERVLAQRFGDAYQRYRQRVRRWL